MKLARPDVFHPRIVLAGCPALPEGDGDDAALVKALRTRGLHARWLSWDDPAALTADLVILRAACDYADRLEEFLDWSRRVPRLVNPPEVLAWNADKRYLADLAAAGVPVAPGALRLGNGETALVFIAGEQSHAFTREPVRRAEPDFELWDLGHAALTAAADHLHIEIAELLYARVDVLGGADAPTLLRLDLVEPSLGWSHLGERERSRQQRRFALAVESALERYGLGPLSHRRP